jgi:hypothetical protein
MKYVNGENNDPAVYAIRGILCTNWKSDYFCPCTRRCWPTTNSNVSSNDNQNTIKYLLQTKHVYENRFYNQHNFYVLSFA